MEHFEFQSSQAHTELIKGERRTQIKEVHVKDGRGAVTIRYIDSKGKELASHTEPLTPAQIRKIMDKRFVPDLFNKCLVGCGTVAAEQTPRNAAKLLAKSASALNRTRRGGRYN